MLVIDFGNSRIKWALFKGDKIQSHNAFAYDAGSLKQDLIRQDLPLGDEKIVIGCVAGDLLKKQLAEYLVSMGSENYYFVETQAKQCNVCNSYDEINNMGVDRWLAMVAAYNHPARKSAEAVCIVDCGTAITIDIVTSDGQHKGGLIMPGYQSVYASLMSKTSDIQRSIKSADKTVNQPLPDVTSANALGNSTKTCVDQGCAQLIAQGVLGIVNQHKRGLSGKLCCFITGGDGEWLSDFMGEGVLNEPLLLLQGLKLVGSVE